MGKVFQHFFSTATDNNGTIAFSKELDKSICDHLERTVCTLKCRNKGESVYITPLTSDAIIMGKCTCFDGKKTGDFYHNYIISNVDAAKIINSDPFFFTKIKFNDGSAPKNINADSLDSLPLSEKDTSGPDKISSIMLQNAYCAFMDIVTNNKTKYISADETFSPEEIIGLAYMVLPIHVALSISFVTCSDSVPTIRYNFCFVEQELLQAITPQNKTSAISLFSSEQVLPIALFPRMGRLLEQSSIDSGEISAFYRFVYDFINIVNKHSGNQLEPMKPELYEAILCIYTYANDYAASQKKDIPADILTAVDWLDKTIDALPSMEQEIRRLVPKTEIVESEEQDSEAMTAKRAEREMATKIIGLISANPTDYKSFVSIKYQVMREARMETISLPLFQNILRSALYTMFENEMDDSRITMAAMAISLAFEVVDYRIFGSECISYAPYDYDAMIEYILMLPLDARLVYNEVISLHKKADMLSIALSNHKKPARRKKTSKQSNDDYSDENVYADEKLKASSDAEQVELIEDNSEQNTATQNIDESDGQFNVLDSDNINTVDNEEVESVSDGIQNLNNSVGAAINGIDLDGISLEDIDKILESSGFDLSAIENLDMNSLDDSSASSFWNAGNGANKQNNNSSQGKSTFGLGRKKNKRK